MAAGSAMAIRKSLESLEDLAYVKEFMPKYSFDCLFDDGKRSETDLVFLNDFSDLLYMKLVSIIQSSDNDEDARRKFTEYVDVSYNIAGKIVNNINKYSSLSDFAEKIHTSEYTKSRIYRALIHIVLDIKEIDILEFEKENSGYARLLGFRKKSGELLSFIKKNSPIKLISKTADAEMILSDAEYKMFKHDVDSAELYDYVQASKGKRSRISEFERQIIICI